MQRLAIPFARTLTRQLQFNASNWNISREIFIMGVDDNLILESPYGGTLDIASVSNDTSLNANASLTLLVSDTDERKYVCDSSYSYTYLSSSPTAGVVVVRKESYPYPTDIPEGRWAVYEVTLPNMPEETVTIAFRSLSDKITLSHQVMTFEPEQWNLPQDLVVYAVDDSANIPSPYPAAFNMTLSSEDMNYNGASLPDFNLTVEDNDEGRYGCAQSHHLYNTNHNQCNPCTFR